ncbi:hypothetical protein HDV00_000445, partial [Rhizophlyctis rosea]
QNVSKFFNTTLPTASRQGVRFLNTTLIPWAKKAHSVSKAITNEVSSNETIPEHIRKKAKKASDFSDLGLSRLENVQGSVNRVATNLGLD